MLSLRASFALVSSSCAAVIAVALVACSGGTGAPASPGADTGSGGGTSGGTGASGSPTSGGASSDGAADAGDDACVLVVDDAGLTHGCNRGGNGPGDRDDGGGATAPPPDASPDASNLPFGASCLDNAQCDSGICFDYRVKGQFCTRRCTTNADCPPSSLGCNGMGICRVGN